MPQGQCWSVGYVETIMV